MAWGDIHIYIYLAPPVCGLLLRVEVHGGHREAQFQLPSEEPGVKPDPSWWLVHQAQSLLLPEQHHYVTVNPHRRPGPHIRQNLLPCIYTPKN